MGMMGKLKEAQSQAEEVKKRLDTVYVTERSPDGKINVILTANKELKEVQIDDALMSDKEELTDMLISALNRGLEKASKVAEQETKASMKDVIPPGLDQFLK